MSNGSEAPAAAVAKKKQQSEREGMQPVRVPNSTATGNSPAACAALFPKLQLGALNQAGASPSAGGSNGASPNSALSAAAHPHELPKLPPACAHEALFPKLHSRAGAAAAGAGGKVSASNVDSADSRAQGHAPIPSTRRARHSNADEHGSHVGASVAASSASALPAPSLPSISPRIDGAAAATAAASLVDRIAAGIGSARALPAEQQVTSRREPSSRKEKETTRESKEGASTKRKKKTKTKQDPSDSTKAAKKEKKQKEKKRAKGQAAGAVADSDEPSFAAVALGSVQRLEGVFVAASDDEAPTEADSDQYSSDDDADDDPAAEQEKEDAYDDEEYSDEYSSSDTEAASPHSQPGSTAEAAAAVPGGVAPAGSSAAIVGEELRTAPSAPAATQVGERGDTRDSIDEEAEGSSVAVARAMAHPTAQAVCVPPVANAATATATAAAADSEEESVAGLLESSPGSQTRRQHPTSLHPAGPAPKKAAPAATAAPAPAGARTVATAAKSSNKKPAVAAGPSRAAASKPASASAAAAAAKKKAAAPQAPSTKPGGSAAKSAAAASAAAAVPNPAPAVEAEDAGAEDTYDEGDWRNQTMRHPSRCSAPALDSDDSLPEELIRFTLAQSTIDSFHARAELDHAGEDAPGQQQGKQKHRHNRRTTLEFCRSQSSALPESDPAGLCAAQPGSAAVQTAPLSARWVPVYSTTLSTASSSAAASASGEASATSVFTLDSLSLGSHDPDESLVIKLWHEVYDSAAVGDDTDRSEQGDTDAPLRATLSRTLLAEFTTSLRELGQQSRGEGTDGDAFSRTIKSPTAASRAAPPGAAAVPPRSALKAARPAGGSGAYSPPGPLGPKLHVRFFDKVEVFRLSARLDSTQPLPLPAHTVAAAAVPEEKSNDARPPVAQQQQSNKSTHAAKDALDLSSLIVSEQAFQRRTASRAPSAAARPAAASSSSAVAGAAPKKPSHKKKDSAGASPARVTATSAPAPRDDAGVVRVCVHGLSLGHPSASGGSGSGRAPTATSPQLEALLLHDGRWVSLYKSETQHGAAVVTWKAFVVSIPPRSLSAPAATAIAAAAGPAGALLDAPLLLRVSHRGDGVSAVLGQCVTSLRALGNAAGVAVTSDAGARESAPRAPPSLTLPLTQPREAAVPRRKDCARLLLTFTPPVTPAPRGGQAGAPAARPASKA